MSYIDEFITLSEAAALQPEVRRLTCCLHHDYIKAASDRIAEQNSSSMLLNMAIVSSQFWTLFRQAREEGNLTEQRQILIAIAKLKDLNRDSPFLKVEFEKQAELQREALRRLSNEELQTLLAQCTDQVASS